MNPRNYRKPAIPDSTRVRCPVCHEAVYSRAGIHPQCAVRQSEPPKPKGKSKETPGVVGRAEEDGGRAGAAGDRPVASMTNGG